MNALKWIMLLLVVASAPALAQDKNPLGNSSDKPIEITADRLEVQQEQKRAIFSGNVLAKQGDVNLKSDKMTVYYSQGGNNAPAESVAGSNSISKIEVDGNVLLATPTESAKGSRGVYDVSRKEIRMIGNVVLMREKNVLNGSNLVYNLTTGKSLLTGGAAPGTTTDGGGRVKGLFIPKENK